MKYLKTLIFGFVLFTFNNLYSQQPENSISSEALATDTVQPVHFPETGLQSNGVNIQCISRNQVFSGSYTISEAMQGRIAGLDIISAQGEIGARAKYLLHGHSISGFYQPLVVIDGIPQSKTDPLINSFNLYMSDYRRKIPVAISDVESIQVLTDGVSSVIYGSEAVDGVILIETKSGAAGPLHLNYQYSQSIQPAPDFPEMLSGDQYTMMQLEAIHNAEGVFTIPAELAPDRDDPDFYNYTADTDWLDLVSQPAGSFNHYLDLSGGDAKNRYFFSLDYQGQKGSIIKTDYKGLSSRFNLSHAFSDQMNLSFRSSFQQNNFNGNAELGRSVLEMAYIKAPNISNMEFDAQGNISGVYFSPIENYQGLDAFYYHPVKVANAARAYQRMSDWSNSVDLHYAIHPGISFRETVNYIYTATKSASYSPSYVLGFISAEDASTTLLDLHRLRSESVIQFSSIGRDQHRHQYSGRINWITEYDSWKVEPGQLYPHSPGILEPRFTHAGVASLRYQFRKRYKVQYHFRAETFEKNNDAAVWDLHNGLALEWQFSEESWLKNLMNGITGGLNVSWSTSVYRPDRYYLPSFPLFLYKDIEVLTGGFDLHFIEDKLHVMADGFRRKIATHGINDSQIRYLNQGMDLMITAALIHQRNFRWSMNINSSYSRTILDQLIGNYNPTLLTVSGQYFSSLVEGEEAGSIYGYLYEGVYSTVEETYARNEDRAYILDSNNEMIPMSYEGTYQFEAGDTKYRDTNFDGIIDQNDMKRLGNSLPKFTGGLGTDLSYKNFSFSVQFHYRSGFQIINQLSLESERMNSTANQSIHVINRWRTPGQDDPNMLHRACMFHPANSLGSDKYIEKGDFLKLNYLHFAYDVKHEFCSRIGLSDLEIILSARRLFTLTKYSGMDPEIERSYSMPAFFAEENLRLPAPVILTLSLQAGI